MTAKRTLLAALVVVLATVGLAGPAMARIKLATLPPRERVEIRLENENATLVVEERVVTLLKGTNHIDFAWANTHINKHTILFRPVGVGEAVRVIHKSYPPGENALVWEVYAEKAGPVTVRISYLIGNLRRTFSYRATAANDEKTLTLRNYMRVWNLSGEAFGENVGLWAGFGEQFRKELGLQESKEVLLQKFVEVPINKKFVFNWRTGPTVPDEPYQRYVRWYYVLHNDTDHELGAYPLPFGKVRIYQDDGKGGEAFLGEDWGQFTPIDDKMKLYLGLARDVKVERTVMKNHRHKVHGNLFHQEVVVKYKMTNFKNDAVTLDIEEDMNHLRNEFCGGKNHPAQWELDTETVDKAGVKSATKAKVYQVIKKGDKEELKLLRSDAEVERLSAGQIEIHVDLPSSPEAADEKPKEFAFLLHVWFRNEW